MQIRQYPDPVLRMGSHDVTEFDDALASLVERMTRLMQEARGVGLAAPQVGIVRRVLVYQPGEDETVAAVVNPRIVTASAEVETEEEGCLSLGAATVVVPVERALSVTIAGATPSGEPLRIDAEGLEARVLQHEIDHLDGVLTIDRTTPEERRAALAQLRPQPLLSA
jgi:peptide deformylase